MVDLAIRDIVKKYGDVPAVNGVSLTVLDGEFLTLLGPSGCGKTTTLRCIAGFVRPDAGCVLIGGRNVTDVPPHRRNIGMVFQSYALFPHKTVLGNVAYGLRIRGISKTEAAKRAEAALELVRLEGLGGRKIRELSGGQQQRVSLARALVYEPSVLLLDEPLSNLDAKLRVEMRVEVRNLQKRSGLTMVYVTHDQEEALSVSDRIVVMRDGRIEQIATPTEIYDAPANTFVAQFIGTSNLLDGEVEIRQGGVATLHLGSGCRVTLPASTPAKVGSRVRIMVRPEHVKIGPVIDRPIDGELQGTILNATLLGATLRYRIALPNQLNILAEVPRYSHQATLAEGENVSCSLTAAAILPLETHQ